MKRREQVDTAFSGMLGRASVGEAAKRVLQDALAWPLNERREVGEQFVDSLDDTDPEWDRAWRSELDARLAEMRAGAEEEVGVLAALSGRRRGE